MAERHDYWVSVCCQQCGRVVLQCALSTLRHTDVASILQAAYAAHSHGMCLLTLEIRQLS